MVIIIIIVIAITHFGLARWLGGSLLLLQLLACKLSGAHSLASRRQRVRGAKSQSRRHIRAHRKSRAPTTTTAKLVGTRDIS